MCVLPEAVVVSVCFSCCTSVTLSQLLFLFCAHLEGGVFLKRHPVMTCQRLLPGKKKDTHCVCVLGGLCVSVFGDRNLCEAIFIRVCVCVEERVSDRQV